MRKSTCSLKFQKLRSEMMSVVGGALRRTPSLDGPFHGGAGDEALPAGEVLAVEELNGPAFFPGAVVLLVDGGGADAGPFEGRVGAAFELIGTFEFAADEAAR